MTWAPRGIRDPGDLEARRRAGTRAWRNTRAMVLKRDGGRCLCGAPAVEVDHVVPVFEGGTDDPANLMAICTPCHKRKTQEEAQRGCASHDRRWHPVEKHPGLFMSDDGGEPRNRLGGEG